MILFRNHYHIVFIQILILYVNFPSLCSESTHDASEMYDVSRITAEEIIRRHKLVEPHLLHIADRQKDWIETYHMTFSSDEIISRKKVASDNKLLMKDPVHNEVPIIDAKGKTFRHKIVEDLLPELKNMEMGVETDHIDFTNIDRKASSRNSVGTKNIDSKIERGSEENISVNKFIDSSTIKLPKRSKYKTASHYSTSDNDKQDKDSVLSESTVFIESEKEKEYSRVVDYLNAEKNIEPGNLNNKHCVFPSNCEILQNGESIDKSTQNYELLLQHKIKDLVYSSGTVDHKTAKDFAFQRKKNVEIEKVEAEVYGMNTKSKVSSKEGAETGFISEHSLGVSKIHDHNDVYHCSVGNMKENFLHVIKELKDLKAIKLNMYEISDGKKCEVDYPTFKAESTDQVVFIKNYIKGSTEKFGAVSKKLHPRQEYVKFFLLSLDKGKENWKETYHFSFKETDSKEVFKSALSDFVRAESGPVSVNPNEVSKNTAHAKLVGIPERLYFNRWLKKLLNKLVDHQYTENVNIGFSFTQDALNDLKKLSTLENYDINYVDELISGLISNATVFNDYNVSASYASFSINFYIIVSIILSITLALILVYYPASRILLIICICILWHGYKMYQEKVSEKQATVSSSSSAYCESILSTESGIFAQFKEFIRYQVYDDHCKKYFQAVMIDPLSELSLPIVVSDFVSSTIFQVFRPMGRTLNAFVKDLFFDLGFVQSFYLFVILTLICILFLSLTLIRNRYKLNFPFFMGSLEPSTALRGSRVEDIALEPTKKNKALKTFSTKYVIECGNKSIHPLQIQNDPTNKVLKNVSTKYVIKCENESVNPLQIQNDPQTEMPRSLKRRFSC